MNKNGFEFSFAWLFAIIAGAAVLFLAIFFATKYVSTSEFEINTKIAAEFVNVLNPLQTSVYDSSAINVFLPSEARIFTSCDSGGNFGRSIVTFSEKIGFGEKFSRAGNPISTENSYLFAENIIEGKKINFLVFSLKMPYKIGDILIAYSDSYCFVNAPRNIERELGDLTEGNSFDVIFTSNKNACPESKPVCFGGFECDINVRCNDNECLSGFVRKDGMDNYFTGKLLYGAIFSSRENYECNVKRLMKRLESVSTIYSKKSQFIASRGCTNTNLLPLIESLRESSGEFERLENLPQISSIADEVNEKNKYLECQLF
ncbi:MAG: hypothetical protein QW727_00840 [Candidatus Pacearchaeota archaeon]